jgi:hypothetical protein
MTSTATVSVADLLESAAPHVSGVGRLDVAIHLHAYFRRVAAGRLGLDLGSDHGHRQAYVLADLMVEAIAKHLIYHGTHPHPRAATTVADWLIGRPVTETRAEIADAAAWWRSAETPGRLP